MSNSQRKNSIQQEDYDRQLSGHPSECPVDLVPNYTGPIPQEGFHPWWEFAGPLNKRRGTFLRFLADYEIDRRSFCGVTMIDAKVLFASLPRMPVDVAKAKTKKASKR